MKLLPYLKDRLYELVLWIFSLFLIIMLLLAFKIDRSVIIAVTFIFNAFEMASILIDFFRKKRFYTDLQKNIEALDKAYLVLETIKKPNFYEGILLFDALYDIDKSMCEMVNTLEDHLSDFKDYIEMWIHEVKIPISGIVLMAHNRKCSLDKKVLDQISKIEYYVEQVLYYARSENAEKDYLINEVSLSKVVNAVALKNKDIFLDEDITLEVRGLDKNVLTDSKWLEFIVNQIVNNSVKYRSLDRPSIIKMTGTKDGDKTILSIRDNGIGIKSAEIPKVFDKSFTGSNGRIVASSTGMGLFIASSLAKKLGHKLEISSKEGKYTEVKIIFYKSKFYDVVK